MTEQRPDGQLRDEVELLDAYWQQLADDPTAEAPNALADELAELSRRLHLEARPADPSPEFVERLRQRFNGSTADSSATTPARRDERRRRWRWWIAVPAAAAAILAAVVAGVLLLDRGAETANAAEILRSAAAAAASPADAGIATIILETVQEEDVLPDYQPTVGGVRQRTVARYWYGGPDRGRYETETSVLDEDGEVASTYGWTTVRADGTVWQYRAATNLVQINIDDGSFRMLSAVLAGDADVPGQTSIDEIVDGLAVNGRGCFEADVTGTEEIAGRAVYVLQLDQVGCFSNSIPGELQGRQVWYIDRETSLVLGRERYTADGALYSRMTATRVEYNTAVDPQVFTFQAPEGATVLDFRPKPAPSDAEFHRQLAEIAGEVDFPLFAPTAIPEGLVPRAPQHPAIPGPVDFDAVAFDYVPPDEAETDTPFGDDGFRVTQQRATYERVVNWTRRAQRIEIGGLEGWLRDGSLTGTDSAAILVRDGTLISVNSFRVAPEVLVEIAASLERVPGGHAALPNPTPPSIEEARAAVDFPIFVPTDVPEGLVAEPPVDGRIDYHDADGVLQLTVLNGPEGCCLAADPRKGGEPVTLASGIEAHLLNIEPEYGGPILWWQQGGAYIALSGPDLTLDDLVRTAESMSPTADLGPVEPPP